MKRRHVEIDVSDHAVLRWLERAQGLDVEGVRALIAGKVLNAAQLAAVAVCVDRVRFMLREQYDRPLPDGGARIVVSTVLHLDQRRGLGVDYAREAREAGD